MLADVGVGAAAGFLLRDEEVLVGEGGDLRQMGDAEDLLGFGQGLELLADGLGCATADADVDFVEDEGAGERGSAAACPSRWQPSSTVTLRASMTRDISPPEAISSSGLSGSPGLVAMG